MKTNSPIEQLREKLAGNEPEKPLVILTGGVVKVDKPPKEWSRYERRTYHRAKMKAKVSREGDPFVWSLGYNDLLGQLKSQEQPFPFLSGSSLNRKKKVKKRRCKTYRVVDNPFAFLPLMQNRTKKKKNNRQKEDKPYAKHLFSKRSRGNVRKRGTAFLHSIPENARRFLTLTMIQDVDDATATRILNKFLTVLRKRYRGIQYLWVAEHQPNREGNTIHYHMLLSRHVGIVAINNLWTIQQYNEGLIGHKSKKKGGGEISKEEIISRYDSQTIGAVLNPAQIEKVWGIEKLQYYLTKYMSKGGKEGETFGCLTWHCSRRVSKLFLRQTVSRSCMAFLLSLENWRVNKKTGVCSAPQMIVGDFYRLLFVNRKSWSVKKLKILRQYNRWIIDGVYGDEIRELLKDEQEYAKMGILKIDAVEYDAKVCSDAFDLDADELTNSRYFGGVDVIHVPSKGILKIDAVEYDAKVCSDAFDLKDKPRKTKLPCMNDEYFYSKNSVCKTNVKPAGVSGGIGGGWKLTGLTDEIFKK